MTHIHRWVQAVECTLRSVTSVYDEGRLVYWVEHWRI
jgi:hypothetical protein